MNTEKDVAEATQPAVKVVTVDPKRPAPGEKVLKMGAGKREILVKTPWTRPLVDKAFSKVSFIPEVTTSLTWQGVKVDVFEGDEVSIPQPHYDIYKRLIKGLHKGKASTIIVEGQAIMVQHGAGTRGME